MPRCPHCQQNGIGVLSKLISSEVMPARCTACGRPSAINTVASMLSHFIVPAWVLLAFISFERNSWALFLGTAVSVVVAWAVTAVTLPSKRVERHEFKINL